MKILFIQDALINAGSEKSHLEILSRLSDTRVSVAYFYPFHDLKKDYERAGLTLFFLNLKRKYGFLIGTYRLVKLLRKDRPNLMVSCLLRSNLMARTASWITHIPLVGTLVNDSYCEDRIKEHHGLSLWKFNFFWWLDRLTAGIPIHWMANAKCLSVSHSITLKLVPAKISVVYRGRGVNINEWAPRAKTGFIFIAYGRLIQRKGFQELLRAMPQVLTVHPEVKMYLYGKGAWEQKLKQIVDELKLNESVILAGSHPEVHTKLAEADCFVFPSWYEGFSGALVEAMMAGIPIIASDIPMNLEAITPGVNALSFKVKDVEDLASKMIYAMEHRKEMALMGQKAREEAITRFDINKIAAQYEETLHRIYSQYKRKV